MPAAIDLHCYCRGVVVLAWWSTGGVKGRGGAARCARCMSLAKSLPKALDGDVNARAVVVCPCAVVLWALAGSVSRPARSGSSYELGILASKRVALCSSESNGALPPLQHSRGFNSRHVLEKCASSRAGSCWALRVESNRTKRVVKLSLPNLRWQVASAHLDRCTSLGLRLATPPSRRFWSNEFQSLVWLVKRSYQQLLTRLKEVATDCVNISRPKGRSTRSHVQLRPYYRHAVPQDTFRMPSLTLRIAMASTRDTCTQRTSAHLLES
jgi:hypothetical protein